MEVYSILIGEMCLLLTGLAPKILIFQPMLIDMSKDNFYS
jgi:hypothetical protein